MINLLWLRMSGNNNRNEKAMEVKGVEEKVETFLDKTNNKSFFQYTQNYINIG